MTDGFAGNAIVSEGQCKQKNCHQECKKSCHVVQTERGLCILVTPASKTTFLPDEFGNCVKRYPFKAVQIINLPRELVEDTTHWLPMMRQVLGLVGTLRPNLGRLHNQKYLTHFRESELESYHTRAVEESLKAQHVDQIKKIVNMLDERGILVQICADRRAKEVFGGELHEWFAIAVGLIEKAETYMLDDSHLLKHGEVTTISDLPDDLAEEILSRVPLTSLSAVRSTCRKWNDLSKTRVFGKLASTAGRKQFLGFMVKDYKVCSMKFDLHGIGNEADFVDPSVKQVSILDQVEISQVFHCEGLLLCVTEDRSRLLVWNPYLGQTRWIQPRITFRSEDRYGVGYDKNHNYKILRVFGKYDTKGVLGSIDKHLVFGYEIYDLSSSSWKVFNVKLDRNIDCYQRGVSLKGHMYYLAEERWMIGRLDNKIDEIIYFDFTTERFVKGLPLPSKILGSFVSLSCVREEQLAVLHQSRVYDDTLEIWVSSNIDDLGSVLWSKFLRSTNYCWIDFLAASFFIDEEKKVVVVVDLDDEGKARTKTRYNQRACIMGQDEYFKPVNVGEILNHGKLDKFGFVDPVFCIPLVCPYVPSSVQLEKCKECYD